MYRDSFAEKAVLHDIDIEPSVAEGYNSIENCKRHNNPLRKIFRRLRIDNPYVEKKLFRSDDRLSLQQHTPSRRHSAKLTFVRNIPKQTIVPRTPTSEVKTDRTRRNSTNCTKKMAQEYEKG